jgi:predicted enzyme related to lactoylglutathione lyase
VRGRKEKTKPHPVVHAEIRSQDPDATRKFYADLFGWAIASEGAFPGYTFIDTGVEGGTHLATSPRQADHDEVLFFVAVDDVAATLSRVEKLGGTVIQPEQQVPGVSFGVFADAQGHQIGVAANH